MAVRRSLVDTAMDESAKEAFVLEENKPKVIRPTVKTKMLNTRIPKDLVRQVKTYCAEHEITVQEFVAQALEEKLQK